MLLLPNSQRDIGQRIESRRKPGVLNATPVTKAYVAASELVQTCEFRIADGGRRIDAHSHSVHQAVPTQPERLESPTPSDVCVDCATVLACQPCPPRRTAGRCAKADGAQLVLARHVGAFPTHRVVLTSAGLPDRPRASLERAANATARDVDRQHIDSLPQSRICRTDDVVRHVSSFWRRRVWAPTACTLSRAGSSPGAPCGGARLPGRRARYPNSRPLVSSLSLWDGSDKAGSDAIARPAHGHSAILTALT